MDISDRKNTLEDQVQASPLALIGQDGELQKVSKESS